MQVRISSLRCSQLKVIKLNLFVKYLLFHFPGHIDADVSLDWSTRIDSYIIYMYVEK